MVTFIIAAFIISALSCRGSGLVTLVRITYLKVTLALKSLTLVLCFFVTGSQTFSHSLIEKIKKAVGDLPLFLFS